MKQLQQNIKILFVCFTIISIIVFVAVIYQSNKAKVVLRSSGEDYYSVQRRYSLAGRIISADDELLAYSKDGKRHYADDTDTAEAFLHMVGDFTHNITDTIEDVYENELLGNGRNLFSQLKLDFMGRGLSGNDLKLTLNAEYTRRAYKLLNGRSGAVVVYNYKNGETLVAVSSPSCPPTNVIDYENIPDTALFNRALRGLYVPGSTFKIPVSLATIKAGFASDNRTVACRGKEEFLPGGVCESYEGAGHGKVDLSEAFAVSCNHYFADAGIRCGKDKVVNAAAALGYNRKLEVDRFNLLQSQCKLQNNANAPLSWAYVGEAQGKDIENISPFHLAMISGMIANAGSMIKPYVVSEMILPDNSVQTLASSKELMQIDTGLAEQLKSLMFGVIEFGTGTDAAVSGYHIGGKTGTTENYDAQGELVLNSLFTGFVDDQKFPLAISVVIEDTDGGAAEVAGELLQTILD